MTISEIYDSILSKIKLLKVSMDLFQKNLSDGNQEDLKSSINQYSNDIASLKNEIENKKSIGLIDETLFNDFNSLLNQLDLQLITIKNLSVRASSDFLQYEQFKQDLNEELSKINSSIEEITIGLASLNLTKITEETAITIKSIKSNLLQITSTLSEFSLNLLQFSSIANPTELNNYTLAIDQLISIINGLVGNIDSSLSSFVSTVLTFKRESENSESNSENSIKWKSAKLSDVFNTSQLKQINSLLQQTQSFFNNIESLLNQAQSFVDIIKQIEGAIQDPLTTLVNKLAKSLKDFIDQFKSTGVYILDMVEYSYIGETRIPQEMKDQIYNIENSKYKDYIQQNYLVNNEALASYDSDSRDSISGDVYNESFNGKNNERIKQLQSKRNLGKLELSDSEKEEYGELKSRAAIGKDGSYILPDPNEQQKLDEYKKRSEESEELKKLLNDPAKILPYWYRFKAFTYEEWIEIIAEAFMDNFDLPDGALVNGTRMNRMIGKNKTSPSSTTGFDEIKKPDVNKFKEAFGKNLDENEAYAYSKLYGSNFKANNFKSGRPQFAKGSISKVVILMISAPDINGFLVNLQLLMKLFSFHSPAGIQTDAKIAFERWKQENSDLSELFPAIDFFKGGRSWDNFLDNVNYKNRINSIIQSGADPDFYGVSLYSLMPELFNNLESILFFLNNYYNDIPPLFGDQFDSMIKLVKDKIQILKNFSNQLNEIILYFEDLLNTSLNILTIESDLGNSDIYDKLVSAIEAPGQDSGRRMFYGGYVIAFGIPDPSKITESLDIDKILKETSVEFDEKTRELKEISTDQFNAFDKIMKAFK